MDKLKKLMCKCGAANTGVLAFSDCDIINHRLIEKLTFEPKNVLIGIVPYYTHYCDQPRTVSAYALAYDYHLYIKSICEKILEKAHEAYPLAHFAWFGDHSPINEKLAAARAGLGIIGEHSLLITPEFSSFIFLFEILTDLECSAKPQPILNCEKCGQCIAACPSDLFDKSACLSAVTQKKGELSERDRVMIRESGCVWGCDICQVVCPHTERAIESGSIYTDVDWFNYNIISSPTQESIADSNDFSKRAYSWRGAGTILRNIEILNSEGKQNG